MQNCRRITNGKNTITWRHNAQRLWNGLNNLAFERLMWSDWTYLSIDAYIRKSGNAPHTQCLWVHTWNRRVRLYRADKLEWNKASRSVCESRPLFQHSAHRHLILALEVILICFDMRVKLISISHRFVFLWYLCRSHAAVQMYKCNDFILTASAAGFVLVVCHMKPAFSLFPVIGEC